MATCIPGKEVEIREIQFAGQMCHAARMFMPPVEHDYCTATRRTLGRPVLIEQGNAIMRCETGFQTGTRCTHIE